MLATSGSLRSFAADSIHALWNWSRIGQILGIRVCTHLAS
jgi:hypothetical protein